MARSIQEIQNDIAATKAAIAERNALGGRLSPEYRAARFDYVVDGDRAGLDAYAGRVAAARAAELQRKFTEEQNRLSRESSERMHEKGLAADRAEKMYQWQKDRAVANAVYRDLLGKKSSERDVREAQANMNWLDSVGKFRGYIRQDADPNYANQEADDYIKTMSRWEEVYPGLEKLLATENVSTDELRGGKDQLGEFVKFQPLHKDYQEYLARFANAIEKNRGKDWKKLKGNIKGRIADRNSTQSELRAFYDQLDPYSDQEDLETVRTDITKAIAARAGIPPEVFNYVISLPSFANDEGWTKAVNAARKKTPLYAGKNKITVQENADKGLDFFYNGKRFASYGGGKVTIR
jgi:hypothetical protein